MHFRESSLIDDVRAFDEPSDWSAPAELGLVHRPSRDEDPTFRSLLEDSENGWRWES
jgi:hypothetical protein